MISFKRLLLVGLLLAGCNSMLNAMHQDANGRWHQANGHFANRAAIAAHLAPPPIVAPLPVPPIVAPLPVPPIVPAPVHGGGVVAPKSWYQSFLPKLVIGGFLTGGYAGAKWIAQRMIQAGMSVTASTNPALVVEYVAEQTPWLLQYSPWWVAAAAVTAAGLWHWISH